jgi:hypothetical protein
MSNQLIEAEVASHQVDERPGVAEGRDELEATTAWLRPSSGP